MRTHEGIARAWTRWQLGSKRGNVKLAWLSRLRLYGEYIALALPEGRGQSFFRRCAVFSTISESLAYRIPEGTLPLPEK